MRAVAPLLIIVLLLAPQGIRAEGSNEIGAGQVLSAATELYVDILDANTETISWYGSGDVTVYAPDGGLEGVVSTGGTLVPGSGNGAYRLALAADQTAEWDVLVPWAGSGRLHSYEWHLDGGGFAADKAIDCSFYAFLPDLEGMTGESVVIETRFEGYAGWSTSLKANSIGTTLADPPTTASGLVSVPSVAATVVPEFALYLNPPARATFGYVGPTLTGVSASPAVAVAGSVPAVLDFNVDVAGHALLQVDADGDGTFNIAQETVAMGPVLPGGNQLEWYGTETDGTLFSDGIYNARLMVVVGLHNLPSVDIETSYLGLRQYLVRVDGSRIPLDMYWNDVAVSSGSVLMPNGVYANETSGATGVSSGDYAMMAVPDWNSRAWGDFSGAGRGNDAVLNTFTFIEDDRSSSISIEVTSEGVAGTAPDRVEKLVIDQNVPNPFNPSTTISYSIAAAGPVGLAIYDLSGRLIKTLVDGHLSAGRKTAQWNGKDTSGKGVASGTYFLRLQTDQGVRTRKVMLAK